MCGPAPCGGRLSPEGGHLSPAVCVSCVFVRLVSPHGFNDPRAHFQAGIMDSWGAGRSQDTCHTTEWGQKKFQQYKGNELLNRPNMTFGVSLQYTLGSLKNKTKKNTGLGRAEGGSLAPTTGPREDKWFPSSQSGGAGGPGRRPRAALTIRGTGGSATGRGGDPIRRVSFCWLPTTFLFSGSVCVCTREAPESRGPRQRWCDPQRGMESSGRSFASSASPEAAVSTLGRPCLSTSPSLTPSLPSLHLSPACTW